MIIQTPEKNLLMRIANGFRASRGIRKNLDGEALVELANQKVESKLPQVIDRTITELTAEDLAGVTSIGQGAFSGCTGLTSVTIPDSVTSIGSSAFSGCNNINRVNIFDLEAWCNITFSWSFSMSDIKRSNPSALIGGKLYLNGELVTKIIINDDAAWKGNGSFAYNNDLKQLVINGNPSLDNYRFAYSALETIDFGNKLTSIGKAAFYDCDGLTSVTIPDSVTGMGFSAFAYCDSLTSVRIGRGITFIRSSAFGNCAALTDIYIDKGEDDISGAPWGAKNATVHWNTPLPTEEA